MSSRLLRPWLASKGITGFNQLYIEAYYKKYRLNPSSVPEMWVKNFAEFDKEIGLEPPKGYAPLASQAQPASEAHEHACQASASQNLAPVHRMLETFRNYGHLIANIDPLGKWERNSTVSFELIDFGLTPQMEVTLFTPVFGKRHWNVAELHKALMDCYTGTIGFQLNHINDHSKRYWLLKQIEAPIPPLTKEEKIENLQRIVRSEAIERAINNKYPGGKRFGSEGGEGFGTFFEHLVKMAADNNYRKVYLGMYHRGRMNHLVNTWNYRSSKLFAFMENKYFFDPVKFTGDVMYHSGADVRFKKVGSKYSNPNNVLFEQEPTDHIDLHMTYNPSHLETGWAVCCGCVRAAQTIYNQTLDDNLNFHRNDFNYSIGTNLVLPVMVHGDSGSCGQGMMYEMTNMAKTRAYTIGGSIHITINNQIGFTTSNRHDARSGIYPTDLGKIVDAPIFHVNSDDIEAIIHVASLAFRYRQRYKENVYVDLVTYRRMGHNEADDPTITQPQMYAEIKAHKFVSDVYAAKLIAEGVIDKKYLAAFRKEAYQELIDDNYTIRFGNLECSETLEHQANFNHKQANYQEPRSEMWEDYGSPQAPSKAELQEIGKQLTKLPEGFVLAPTAQRLFTKRLDTATNDLPVTWAEAELFAYASVLTKGKNIRLTGEDVGRGTFAHRHAIVHNVNKEQEFIPLAQFASQHGTQFEVFDSVLSEEGTIAFEYGYSIEDPNTLDIWEAQFGDFANCGQVMIDNFISCMESRINQRSGLTLFLPHGWEGVGAEHSSARLERYLQLCSRGNMRVVHPTNAKQIYHLILQQGLITEPKPLIVAGPKSFIRQAETVTSFDELAQGRWENLITDPQLFAQNKDTCEKVVLSVGRLRYDVQHALEKSNYGDGKVIQVNLEQLYPFPGTEFVALLKQLPNLKTVEWTQEEPENQGSWQYGYFELRKLFDKHGLSLNITLNSRKACPVTSRCFDSLNNAELEEILEHLLDLPGRDWRTMSNQEPVFSPFEE